MKDECNKPDKLFLGPPSPDGEGVLCARRHADGRASMGILRRAVEGRPLVGEAVSVTANPDEPINRLDVRTIISAEEVQSANAASAASANRHGPPNVATAAYRQGHERIFGPDKWSN